MRALRTALAFLGLVAVGAGCSADSGESGEESGTEGIPTADDNLIQGPRQCGQDPFAAAAVRGIDVSKHQGTVDFEKVAGATGVKLTTTTFNTGGKRRAERVLPGKVVFAATRVSDGLEIVDATFLGNMKKIRAAGLIPGAYQFLRPTQDATAQANLFIAKLDAAGGYKKGDLPPTVDIEVSSGTTPAQVQAGVKTWLKLVGDHFHVKPMVYSLSGISSYLGSSLTASPLWIANFYQTCPKMPSAWMTPREIPWTFFQFDDAGHVDGIAAGNYVDLNVFNGTRAQFDAFLANAYVGP